MKSYIKDHKLLVEDGATFQLKNHSSTYSGGLSKKEADKLLEKSNERLYQLQRRLYANDNHSILLIFQAMDAAGKDSTIRTVFSGVNPQGFQVTSFKAPSKRELDHDFIWRCGRALPERGRIGIFNRSHYEEVLVCKVHPEYVLGQRIPGIDALEKMDEAFWEGRYDSIRNWEEHLVKNGTLILKFFLNVSKDEQKNRFISRIKEPRKNWKFNSGDMSERKLWPKYMDVYQTAIQKTATKQAPWYVIPADNKPVMRAMVGSIVAETLENLDLQYPTVSAKDLTEMKEAKEILENE